MFAGGFFANGGRVALPLMMLSGMLGAIVSDNTVYWIGRCGGRLLLNRILKTRLLSFLLGARSLGKIERYFEEHGGKTIFLGRFGPGLRSITPLFARVSHMKYRRFLPYSLVSATIWAIVGATIGYVFGEYWGELLAVARSVGYGFVALVAFIVALYVYRRRRLAKRDRSKAEKE